MNLDQLDLQLSPLDREILKGAIAGESYQVISDRLHYCHEHIRERGASLFQQLSLRLGREVSKRNCREQIGGLFENSSKFSSGNRRRHHPSRYDGSAKNYQASLG